MISKFVNTDETADEPYSAAEHRAQSMQLLHEAGAPDVRSITAANMLRAATVHALLAFCAQLQEENAPQPAGVADPPAAFGERPAGYQPAGPAESTDTELAS